jgi:hypothetical protein
MNSAQQKGCGMQPPDITKKYVTKQIVKALRIEQPAHVMNPFK